MSEEHLGIFLVQVLLLLGLARGLGEVLRRFGHPPLVGEIAIGLLLGAMFQLTGSLVGPLAAHALINALNLLYLKRHDPKPPRRALGGLLGQGG